MALQAQEWGWLDCLYLLSLSIAAPAATMVPVVYWPFSTVSVHNYVLQSLAIGLLLVEMLASRAPLVSYHWQVQMHTKWLKNVLLPSSENAKRADQVCALGVPAVLLSIFGCPLDTSSNHRTLALQTAELVKQQLHHCICWPVGSESCHLVCVVSKFCCSMSCFFAPQNSLHDSLVSQCMLTKCVSVHVEDSWPQQKVYAFET